MPTSFIADGYNVVTWDARGFGTSEGIVMIDHPKFEAKDVSALIDFIAEQRGATYGYDIARDYDNFRKELQLYWGEDGPGSHFKAYGPRPNCK